MPLPPQDHPQGPHDVVGIDVGAARVHGVRLDPGCRLVDARDFAADDLEAVVAWAGGAGVAAIDGPDAASVGAHAGDTTLAPKFRAARTGEVALGRHHGLWVSWATPPALPAGGWMAVAAALHHALSAAGAETLEVYPHGAFRELAGGAHLPSKRTGDGRARRAELLSAEIAGADRLAARSHDALDAAAAAVVAADRRAGHAVAAGPRPGDPPGDDGSRIWLPRRR
ncbi:DUF429 domain-containing protein [Patulibacter americanus]|uniref:DUF429 domain-containing protein n=1 Tax=Patulibacter americanus TaxID=588672 RepID=UPI0003B3537E|nr:DUF429 domain-containing protein [Patulibacter americanus]